MDIQYVYSKSKSDLRKKCIFTDNEPTLVTNISSDVACTSSYVLKDTVNAQVQCGAQYAKHEVNTVRLSYESRGVNHTEGGWPKDINHLDSEQVIRFRKKIEKDDTYINCVYQLSHTMEHCILQNNAIDAYEQYFNKTEDAMFHSGDASCRTAAIFRDPCTVGRPVRRISWSPDGGSRIAASYCNLDSDSVGSTSCTQSYVWDIASANKPETTLEPAVPIISLEYNPKDSHSLLSGLNNGQVAIWDTRKCTDPVEVSSMENSHGEPALHTLWINSKTGTEFFSGSLDGQLKWWDTRKLCEPVESLIIDTTKGETPRSVNAHGVSALEYDNSVPLRFTVGTETGLVISGNRKGKTHAEKFTTVYKAHYGPVYSLQRNPGFVKIFLSIGDWRAKIWSEDCRESAIIWTDYQQCNLTCGAWSPTKYSVFYTVKENGTLDVWDILQNQKRPLYSVQVCNECLRCLRCHENGRIVGVGNDLGNIHLVEVSENISVLAKNDKTLLTSMFERESRREKIIESKLKEIRLKNKVARLIDSQQPADKDRNKSLSSADPDYFSCIDVVEKEFLATIEQEKKNCLQLQELVPQEEEHTNL